MNNRRPSNQKQSRKRVTEEDKTNATTRENQQPAIQPSTTRSQFVCNFIRRLFILGLAAAVTFMALMSKKGDSNYDTFVTSESSPRRSFQVPCSDDYSSKWQECIPRRCGRVVMDDLFSSAEIDQLLSVAKQGFRLAGSDGGFSSFDLHTGVVTTGKTNVNIYKLPEAGKVFTKRDFGILGKLRTVIQLRITMEFGGVPERLFPTYPITISRMTSDAVQRIRDEYWRPRVDKEKHGAWHYTALIHLGTYGSDFEGGRFVLVDSNTNRTVEPRKGRLTLFTSGSENLQYTERVKSGEYYLLTIAFTCDPGLARQDPTLQDMKIAARSAVA